MAVKKNARGNYIGSHIVSELGEEGPEMVIPLSNHRNRALKLWEQAGNILGVKRYARGGIAGQGNIRGTRGTSSGGVQVNVASGAIQITVQAGGSSDIVTAIRSGRKEITDAILNAIVDACGTSYTNRTAEVMYWKSISQGQRAAAPSKRLRFPLSRKRSNIRRKQGFRNTKSSIKDRF